MFTKTGGSCRIAFRNFLLNIVIGSRKSHVVLEIKLRGQRKGIEKTLKTLCIPLLKRQVDQNIPELWFGLTPMAKDSKLNLKLMSIQTPSVTTTLAYISVKQFSETKVLSTDVNCNLSQNLLRRKIQRSILLPYIIKPPTLVRRRTKHPKHQRPVADMVVTKLHSSTAPGRLLRSAGGSRAIATEEHRARLVQPKAVKRSSHVSRIWLFLWGEEKYHPGASAWGAL